MFFFKIPPADSRSIYMYLNETNVGDSPVNQNLSIALQPHPWKLTELLFSINSWGYPPSNGHFGLFKTHLTVSSRSEVIPSLGRV
jgi:hypothetical protein